MVGIDVHIIEREYQKAQEALGAVETELEEAKRKWDSARRQVDALRAVLEASGAAPEREVRTTTASSFVDWPLADQIEAVLREAGQEVHYKDIWSRLEQRGVRSRAQTPEASVAGTLSVHTGKRFTQGEKRGYWTLVPSLRPSKEGGNAGDV